MYDNMDTIPVYIVNIDIIYVHGICINVYTHTHTYIYILDFGKLIK